MHEAYIDLVVSTIKEQFLSEAIFLKDILLVSEERWRQWKSGESALTPEENQKIKLLYSDYEWMLLQKILRQTVIYPEKRWTSVVEFQKIKVQIAQKWLNSGLGIAEIVDEKEERQDTRNFTLRVSIDYNHWGFDDILQFRIPASIQQQVASEPVALLNWVNHNLNEQK